MAATHSEEEKEEKERIMAKFISTKVVTLHELIKLDDVDGIKALADNGANLETRDKLDYTPAFFAVLEDKPRALEQLLRSGCNKTAVTGHGLTLTHFAALDGKLECLQILVAAGCDKEARDTDDATPLHYSMKPKSVECAKYLIREGCDIYARDRHGRTALHLVCDLGVAEMLLAAGCDPAVGRYSDGMNALEFLQQASQHPDIIHLLTQHLTLSQ